MRRSGDLVSNFRLAPIYRLLYIDYYIKNCFWTGVISMYRCPYRVVFISHHKPSKRGKRGQKGAKGVKGAFGYLKKVIVSYLSSH